MTSDRARGRRAAGPVLLVLLVAGLLVLPGLGGPSGTGGAPAAHAQSDGVRYDTCAEALAAGRHDILRTDPEWNANLEHGADGIACKLAPRPTPVSAQSAAPPPPPPGPPVSSGTLTAAVVLIVAGAVVAVLVGRREREGS